MRLQQENGIDVEPAQKKNQRITYSRVLWLRQAEEQRTLYAWINEETGEKRIGIDSGSDPCPEITVIPLMLETLSAGTRVEVVSDDDIVCSRFIARYVPRDR